MKNVFTSSFLPRLTRGFTPLAACSAAVLLGACGADDSTGKATRTAAGMSSSIGSNATADTADVYVAPDGADTNPGTQAAPYQTITRAAAGATPGTTVHVAPGTYAGNVTTSASGSADKRIRIVSDTRWGARIVGTGSEAMWTNSGDYVDIRGFDISGPGRLGILNTASDTLVADNHIHHLRISGGCTGSGGAGVVNANYAGRNGDVIGNIVHDIGTPGACNGVQGIYSSNKGGHIMNNAVYRVSSYGIHLWHAATGVMILNNTVFANGSTRMGGGIVIGSGDSGGGQLRNTKVINNIVYDNPRAGIQQYCNPGDSCIGAGNTVQNNLVYGSASAISMRVGSATGTILADPEFVAYSPDGNGDFRLRPGSPAANAGLAYPALFADVLGVLRPQGSAVDLGAFQTF